MKKIFWAIYDWVYDWYVYFLCMKAMREYKQGKLNFRPWQEVKAELEEMWSEGEKNS